MDIHETARQYRDLGFSVIPIQANGSKAPAVNTWKEYQRRHPTDEELQNWFGSGELVGLAIVGGRVSGGLEVLDFDDNSALEAWLGDPAIKENEAWQNLPRVRTPSGGVHLYIRRETCGNCRKLAMDEKGETLIEVKAEGGYVLAPGCPPECHHLGAEYVWEVPLPSAESA